MYALTEALTDIKLSRWEGALYFFMASPYRLALRASNWRFSRPSSTIAGRWPVLRPELGGGALNLNAWGSKNLMASENRSAQNLNGSVAVGEVTQNLMVVGLTVWNLKISRGGQQLVLVAASEKSEEAVVTAVVG